MSFLSQPGFSGFKTQTAKGTYTDPGAIAPNQGTYCRLRAGAMDTMRTLLIPDAEIGGNRDIPDAQLGPAAFVGNYSMYLRPESIAFFLKAVLGNCVDAGTALAGYTHTITPVDSVSLPWVSIEEQIGNGFMNLKYTDCKVNMFHMECGADTYFTGTADVMGMTQIVDATPTILSAQRWDTSPMLVGPQITVSYNAVTLPAKSFKFDVVNNVDDKDFRLGSLFLGDLVEKRREINMGVQIRPQDASLWKQALWGSSAATVLGGSKTSKQIVITITSYDDIPGATAGTKYSLVFTIPNGVIKPINVKIANDAIIDEDLEILSLRPAPATPLITAVITNSYATAP